MNGVKGDVIDIGITKTTLMEIGNWVSGDNYSGRIVQISNSFIFKGSVHNYSTDFPFVWDEINLPIRYGSDIVLAKEIILNEIFYLQQPSVAVVENRTKVMFAGIAIVFPVLKEITLNIGRFQSISSDI